MFKRSLSYWGCKILNLWGISLIVFALPHLMPGPPVNLYESWPVNTQHRARLVAEYGFDQSLLSQYAIWLQRTATGQWGSSRYYNRPIFRDVWHATRMTLLLLLWTLLVCGLWLTIVWGVQRVWPALRTRLHPSTLLPFIHALPNFLVAIVLRDLAVWHLGWVRMPHVPLFDLYYLPDSFYMLLGAFALAFTPLVIWHLGSQSDTQADFSTRWGSLRQRWQQFCLAFRPYVDGFLLEVLLIEHVLVFPGLGSLGIEALKRRDFPTLQGFLMCTAGLYFVLRLVCEWGTRQGQAVPLPACQERTPVLGARSSAAALYHSMWCLLILLILAAVAPWLVPYDPMEIHSRDQFLSPGYRYFLGTDFLGRDVLSRTLRGFRSSIPRAILIAAITGGVGWLLLILAQRLPKPLRSLWRAGLALGQAVPSFLFAFTTFLVLEQRAWALEGALCLAYLPAAGYALRHGPTWLHRLAQGVQLAGGILLLEVTFYFLNLSTESFIPTWGSDIRHSMHYGHLNMWMLVAPALAVVWSRYIFQHLHSHVASPTQAVMDRDYTETARRRNTRKSPAANMTTLMMWGTRRGPT